MIDLIPTVDHCSVLGFEDSFHEVGKLVNLVVMVMHTNTITMRFIEI